MYRIVLISRKVGEYGYKVVTIVNREGTYMTQEDNGGIYDKGKNLVRREGKRKGWVL